MNQLCIARCRLGFAGSLMAFSALLPSLALARDTSSDKDVFAISIDQDLALAHAQPDPGSWQFSVWKVASQPLSAELASAERALRQILEDERLQHPKRAVPSAIAGRLALVLAERGQWDDLERLLADPAIGQALGPSTPKVLLYAYERTATAASDADIADTVWPLSRPYRGRANGGWSAQRLAARAYRRSGDTSRAGAAEEYLRTLGR